MIEHLDARGAQRGVSHEILQAIRMAEDRAVSRSIHGVVDEHQRGGHFRSTFRR